MSFIGNVVASSGDLTRAEADALYSPQMEYFTPEQLAADPTWASGDQGRIWWNTTSSQLKYFDGTADPGPGAVKTMASGLMFLCQGTAGPNDLYARVLDNDVVSAVLLGNTIDAQGRIPVITEQGLAVNVPGGPGYGGFQGYLYADIAANEPEIPTPSSTDNGLPFASLFGAEGLRFHGPSRNATIGGGPSAGEANVQADWNEADVSSDAHILNKPTIPPDNSVAVGVNSAHSASPHAPANAEQNVQSDWSETDTGSDAHILNKPTLGTASPLNVAGSAGAEASATEVVRGDDPRLSITFETRAASAAHSPDITAQSGSNIPVTANTAVTLPTTGVSDGKMYVIRLQHDATTNTYTVGFNISFPDGKTPSLPDTANAGLQVIASWSALLNRWLGDFDIYS